ncbi:MAG: hypothetical protein K8L99_06560 [Anaerolineae bacterium]|nr:hypothetical protein [Anaerolineae bacterium]
MGGIVDVNAILLALALGFVVGVSIILFLFYAAVKAAISARDEMVEDPMRWRTIQNWSSSVVYETRRAHLHAIVRDPEVLDW